MKKLFFLSFLMMAMLNVMAAPKKAKAVKQPELQLCPLFSNNMVIQQQRSDAPLWGTAKAGKKVTVTTSWNNQRYSTIAGDDGRWRVEVSTPNAGGPYVITIEAGKTVKLDNVMIGEVWLCSGQSNMEFMLNSVNNSDAEIADADKHSNIRLLRVARNISPVAEDNFTTSIGEGWNVCSADVARNFSAVGYLFGRELEQYRNVPIGLIDASWGGTIIETWISTDGLKVMPSQQRNIDYVAHLPLDKDERIAQFNREIHDWHATVRDIDPGYDGTTPTWASPSYDDSAWGCIAYKRGETVEPQEIMGLDGFIWERRTINIPEEWAGKDLFLNLGGVDDNDITWFNGEEIGHIDGVIFRREYTIPGRLVKAGRNVLTVRIQDTGGFGGFYPNDDNFYISANKESKERIVDLEGNWHYRLGCSTMQLPVMPVNTANEPNVHTFLYNAMIHPLQDYAMQGAIWYQGESNSDQSLQYRELMPMLIKDWRRQWHSTLPFFIVQLANYKQRTAQPEESTWAELREAQYLTAQHLEKTGMACIIDIGEANDIHPKNKQDVGHRLALQARAIAYGERLNPNGPQMRGYRIEGDKIRVNFGFMGRNQQGSSLMAGNERLGIKGGKLRGFAICGPDHVFHWADAEIDGNSVVVSSKEVPFPVAVRYAWGDNPDCNLYNKEGLPAVPFRTDDFPCIGIMVR